VRSYAVNSEKLPAHLAPVLQKCVARYPRLVLKKVWHIGDTTLDRLLSGGVATRPVIERMVVALTEDLMSTEKKTGGGERINEEPVPTTTTQPHPPGAQPGVQVGNHSKQQEDAQMAGSNPQQPGKQGTGTTPQHGGQPGQQGTTKPGVPGEKGGQHSDAQEKAKKESGK